MRASTPASSSADRAAGGRDPNRQADSGDRAGGSRASNRRTGLGDRAARLLRPGQGDRAGGRRTGLGDRAVGLLRPGRLVRFRGRRGLGAAMTAVVAVAAVFAPRLAPFDPFALSGPPLAGPSRTHLMGTDALGRDLFSAIVHGARTSLAVGLSTAVAAAAIGLLIGLVSGYLGGAADGGLMRLTEFVQIIPRFFLAIVVLAMFGEGYVNLVIVLAASSWPVIARAVRSLVLSERERAHVDAARSLGAKRRRIIGREILPAVWRTVAVMTGLLVADTILIEAGLSFLGLGDPDQASWGLLASNAQQHLRTAWWMPFFPGAAIVVAVLGVNLLVDSWSDDDTLLTR